MKIIILSAAVLITLTASSQNNTASNIIEGGKTLVELVKVFKAPKYATYQQNVVEKAEKKDSCSLKNVCDLCYKNNTDTSLYISLFKRNGNNYEANVLSIKVLPKNQECWFELKAGIYKFKIEMDGEGDERVLYREGEMKLEACGNIVKEIKF